MTRNHFMAFFRNDDKLQTLSADDRIEIFLRVLPGGSDITLDLLDELLSDYQVNKLQISPIKNG